MKKLTQLAAVAMFGFAALASTTANALQATGTFNVNINLTASCTVGTIADVTINYTSNQTTAVGPIATTAAVTCTTGVPYTVLLSAAPASDDITGIVYTTAITGTPPSVGNGAAQTVNIAVSAAANQAGGCTAPGAFAASVCANTASLNKVQTLTVTY